MMQKEQILAQLQWLEKGLADRLDAGIRFVRAYPLARHLSPVLLLSRCSVVFLS